MNTHQMILLSQKLVMLSLATDNTEKTRLTQEIAALNAELTESARSNEKTVCCGPLKFTEKEISRMPKTFRKEFRVEGCTAHVRKRCDGRYRCSYEIRYRRNGYNVTASATTLDEAKQKFIEKLKQADKVRPIHTADGNRVPTTFNEFAYFWFEHFHKRKVAEQTYKNDMWRFRRALEPPFAQRALRSINPVEIQQILDDFTAQGKCKTADEVRSLLNQILNCAVKFGLIQHNPVQMVFHKQHERKHGSALSLEEERLLLSATAGTHYQLMYAVALYTGLRPNEYKTVKIKGQMLIANNSKRKNGEVATKRIPILKMLQPYLDGVQTIKWVSLKYLREKFNSILPNHILYDLRTTFYTHCVTCGVAQSAINEMVGHSGGVLKDTYTDLPDEFLFKEAEKLVW